MRTRGWLLLLVVASCAGPGAAPDGCADAVSAEAVRDGDGTFSFSVTVRSADTGWDKYADRWEVVAPDGTILGQRILAHPHETEQPFTRSQAGIAIPDGIDRVAVRVHDSVAGFCGAAADVAVPQE
jgi:hypothetical protein